MINSLTDYLTHSATERPNHIALKTKDAQWTYATLQASTRRLAALLLELGVKRGDRIVCACGNSSESVITFWATLSIGAVISIIDPKQGLEKILYTLNDSQAAVFIHEDRLQIDSLQIPCLAQSQLLAELADQLPLSKALHHLDIDLASIIYTSGSTGEPKGVMHTHRSMLAASQSINSYLQNSANDIVLSALPLAFDYGLYQIIMMAAVGGTLILEKDFVLPSRFLKLIENEKPTAVPLVPSMVPLLSQFQLLKPYNLSSVRYVTNTGAALMGKHIETIQQLFSNAQLFSMYGVTESKRCTYLPPEDLYRKPGSIGIAIPGTEMWIAGESGEKLGPHEIGEIVVRGQTVMRGYWRKPEATAKRLKPGLIPGESILHTGDFGHIDEEGYFYFYGRVDEVIKSRGMKVSPKEIETIINTHDSVIETAAIGIDHEQFGQAIVLFVSTQDSNLQPQILEAFCKANLQAHQQAIDIVILKNLPKTSNGKLNKRQLTADYLAQVEALQSA